MTNARKEQIIRRRARDQFEWFAPNCLQIMTKGHDADLKGALAPLNLNDAQDYIHARIERQRRETGKVRAIILKGRQQGASTYTEGRFYWKVIHKKAVNAYILTHSGDATENLFGMVERYHDHCPPMFKPHVGKKNAREFEFDRMDSRYIVATAGAKGAGRSRTIHFFHGSEVAFWEHASEHLSGALQAVPEAPDTEIILESTANGMDNEFYALWKAAESGHSEFIAIFVPWFWQREYRALADDFEASDNPAEVPEGELTEFDYQDLYGLDDGQMMWRRNKIAALGADGYWKFKREYPATAAEAFQASGTRSLIPVNLIIKARKNNIANPRGSLLLGVDPARTGDDFAMIRRRGRRAYGLTRFQKVRGPQGTSLIVRAIKNEDPRYVFIDVGGLGAIIYDYLLETPYASRIVPVNFGGAALDPEKYANKRAEIYGNLLEWFGSEAGVEIPDEDQLQAEIASIDFTYRGEQQLILKSKEQMRKDNKPSPDGSDALATTFAYPVSLEEGMPEADVDQHAGWPDRSKQDEQNDGWTVDGW